MSSRRRTRGGYPGYPYAVYYRSDSAQITVLAVFHTSRDPAIWQSRV